MSDCQTSSRRDSPSSTLNSTREIPFISFGTSKHLLVAGTQPMRLVSTTQLNTRIRMNSRKICSDATWIKQLTDLKVVNSKPVFLCVFGVETARSPSVPLQQHAIKSSTVTKSFSEEAAEFDVQAASKYLIANFKVPHLPPPPTRLIPNFQRIPKHLHSTVAKLYDAIVDSSQINSDPSQLPSSTDWYTLVPFSSLFSMCIIYSTDSLGSSISPRTATFPAITSSSTVILPSDSSNDNDNKRWLNRI
ncbi:hypothetical protein CPC08DRAFT_823891 [Agrocybe pediades]|nr:hypothetical protein CPC08DRAFT_823891 [Agrocybe pediades]